MIDSEHGFRAFGLKRTDRVALLVLGMHRSGTSAAAGVLHHLGVALGSELLPGTPQNTRGYFEHAEIVQIHQEALTALQSGWDDPRPRPASWHGDPRLTPYRKRLEAVVEREFSDAGLWAVKDPRLCRLLPWWLPILRDLRIEARHLLVVRHPSEVAASLNARDRIPHTIAGLLWLRHVLEAEQATRGQRRAWLMYRDLADWEGFIEPVRRQLDVEWPNDTAKARLAIAHFLSPMLRHQRDHSFAQFAPPIGSWLERLYAAISESGAVEGTALPNLGAAILEELAALERSGRINYGSTA